MNEALAFLVALLTVSSLVGWLLFVRERKRVKALLIDAGIAQSHVDGLRKANARLMQSMALQAKRLQRFDPDSEQLS